MDTIMKIFKSPLSWVVTTLLFGATGLIVFAVISLVALLLSVILKKL